MLKRTALRTTLLTTSSMLALVVALDRPASAASCTVVTNPSLPYIQSGNTCVNFTASPVTSGNVTSTGTVSATGPTFAQSRTGITVFIGVSLNGGITNQGTINANGSGIFMDQSTVTGSVVNATGAAITGADGINLSGAGGGGRNASVGGSVINNGSIDSLGGGGIGVGNIVVTGSVINGSTGTITGSGAGMFISNASVGGSISNGGTISVGNAFTALAVVNGGTVAGSVINTGNITNTNASTNIGIWLEGQTVGGSLSNGGTVTAGFGMYVSNSPNSGGTVAGNVVNGKTIIAQSASGIVVAGATVQGLVSNSGTITAHQVGIAVTTGYHNVPGTVVGGIVNTGSISGVTGIAVTKGSVIPGGITTSGTINGSTAAINLSGEGAPTTITVLGGAITGNIIGGSDTMNFTLGSGSFSYSNTISGMTAVNVNSGTLFDGGAISAGSVHINGGGVLAPGLPHTVGTLSITGSLAFASAAVYLDTISGANAGKTVVTGTATLGGASVQVASGSTIQFNTRYTILTANSGVTGTFNPAITYNGDTGTLSYDADDVYLTFGEPSLLALLPPGAPRNVVDVANAIDNFFSNSGALPPQFSNLFSLSGTQLQNALTQLDGEDSTGAEGGAFHLMNAFLELMLDPYVYGRGDSAAGGQPLGFAPDQADSLPPDIALAYASLLKAPSKQSFLQRWTAWGSGFGGSATANGNPGTGSNNVTTGTFGYAAGLDYHYSPDTVVGFALSGGGTNWNLAQGLGTGRSDAFLAGIYGVTHQGPAYVAGSLAFANNWFTTNRVALGDQLTASFQGQSYAARLEGGYRFAMPTAHNVVGVTPYAAIQAQNFRTPSYSETDLTSGGFGLTYAAMNGTDTRSELGARFDDLTALGYLPLMLRARVAWAHDWLTNPALNASFESLPGSSFTVFGAPNPHDSALTSAGAELFFTPNWSLLAKFDGEFASGSQLYAGSGTLRYTW